MRIFLSYGRGDNEPIVAAIEAALRADNHEIWKDTAEIKSGNDWRETIERGLANTDWVVAILSRHTVRDPGVCRDELAIAMTLRGGGITPILVEPATQVEAPHSVAHANWIDMSDWPAKRANAA